MFYYPKEQVEIKNTHREESWDKGCQFFSEYEYFNLSTRWYWVLLPSTI